MCESGGVPFVVMTSELIRFVDPDDWPSVRLNVNNGAICVGETKRYWKQEGTEFPVPDPDQSWLEPDMVDGEELISTRQPNRVITLVLLVEADTKVLLDAAMRELLQEINRFNNCIEYRPTGAAESLYYTTYQYMSIRHEDYFRGSSRDSLGAQMVTIEIPCYPWARKSERTITPLDPLGLNDSFEDGESVLTEEDTNFEGGTIGGWGLLTNCGIVNSVAEAYRGSHSLKMTVTGNGTAETGLDVTSITDAGSSYEFTVRFKSASGRDYYLRMYDDLGSTTGTRVTADGTWQTVTVNKMFSGASTIRQVYLCAFTDALAGDIVYWDYCLLGTSSFSQWVENAVGWALIEEDTTNFLAGIIGCKLRTTGIAANGEAEVTDKDFISVDSAKHYNIHVFAYKISGTPLLDVDVECFDSGDNSLGTLNLLADFDPPVATKWLDVCEENGVGVINPVGGAANAFFANTVKIKRSIRNQTWTVPGVITIDRLLFIETESIPGHKVSGAMGLNILEGTIEGDAPAECDIYFDVVYDRFTNLILGQRNEYHEDFNPVQEPIVGTQQLLWTRRSQDYRTVPALTNLCLNRSFETYAGVPDNWNNWAETRNYGSLMEASVAEFYEGLASVRIGRAAVSGGVWCFLVSDMIAVDDTKQHYLSVMSKYGDVMGSDMRLDLAVYYYDAGSNLLNSKGFCNMAQVTSAWERYEGFIDPSEFPASTTQIRILVGGRNVNPITNGWLYIDYVTFGEVPSAGTIEAKYPLDAHQGKFLVSAGMSFGAATSFAEITVQALLMTDADEEITPLITSHVVDFDDPNTDFKEAALMPGRWPSLTFPSHAVSKNADLSKINQVIRLTTDPRNTQAFWYDQIEIIPTDRPFVKLSNWVDKDHLILDCRSSRAVLASLDGTLDKAMVYDTSKWIATMKFVADPKGMNLTLLLIKDDDGDHQLNPVVGMKITYKPKLFLSQ